jgi:hypothetical protein
LKCISHEENLSFFGEKTHFLTKVDLSANCTSFLANKKSKKE